MSVAVVEQPSFMITGPILAEILRRNKTRANMARVARQLGMSTSAKRRGNPPISPVPAIRDPQS